MKYTVIDVLIRRTLIKKRGISLVIVELRSSTELCVTTRVIGIRDENTDNIDGPGVVTVGDESLRENSKFHEKNFEVLITF